MRFQRFGERAGDEHLPFLRHRAVDKPDALRRVVCLDRFGRIVRRYARKRGYLVIRKTALFVLRFKEVNILVQTRIQRAQVGISIHVDVHAVTVKYLILNSRVRRLERHERKKAQHRRDDEDEDLLEDVCRRIGAFAPVRTE